MYDLIESFTETPDLSFVFKMCNIRPTPALLDYRMRRNDKIYYHWHDDFGSAVLISNKKPKIKLNELTVPPIHTDSYGNFSIDRLIKISSQAIIFSGFDEDTNSDMLLISMLGLDTKCRTYLYYMNEWHHVSNLFIGFDNLFKFKNKFTISKNEDEAIYFPANNVESFLTSLPCSEAIFKHLTTKHKLDMSFLK